MSFDPAVVAEWLYGKLSTETRFDAILPGGVWRDMAPQNTAYPFITFHRQAGGQDTTSISRRRILSNGLYLIRATGIVGDSDQDLDTIASIVDDVLDRASGDAGTGHVYMATRETAWAPPGYDNEGQTYREAGGLYRIWVQDPVAV